MPTQKIYYSIASIVAAAVLFLGIHNSTLDENLKSFSYGAIIVAISAMMIYFLRIAIYRVSTRIHDDTETIEEEEHFACLVRLKKENCLEVHTLGKHEASHSLLILKPEEYSRFKDNKEYSWERKKDDRVEITEYFMPPKNGTYIVVVENNEKETISVEIKILVQY